MNKETLDKANKVLASLECAKDVLGKIRQSLSLYTTPCEYNNRIPSCSILKAELVVEERDNYQEGSTQHEAHYTLNKELTIIVAGIIVDYLEKRTEELEKEFENL